MLSMIICLGDKNQIITDSRILEAIEGQTKTIDLLTRSGKDCSNIIIGKSHFKSISTTQANDSNYYVLSRNKYNYKRINLHAEDDIKEIIKFKEKSDEYFIVGGVSIFTQLLPHCSKLYVTSVDVNVNYIDDFCFNSDAWDKLSQSSLKIVEVDVLGKLQYTYSVFKRKEIKKPVIEEWLKDSPVLYTERDEYSQRQVYLSPDNNLTLVLRSGDAEIVNFKTFEINTGITSSSLGKLETELCDFGFNTVINNIFDTIIRGLVTIIGGYVGWQRNTVQ